MTLNGLHGVIPQKMVLFFPKHVRITSNGTNPALRKAMNPNLSHIQVCCELVYMQRALGIRTVLIERLEGLFVSAFVSLCTFIPSYISSSVGLFVSARITFLLVIYEYINIYVIIFNKCLTMKKMVIREPAAKKCIGEPSTSAHLTSGNVSATASAMCST
jgi:hypothetical protein